MTLCENQQPRYYLTTPRSTNALQDHQPGIEPKRKCNSSIHMGVEMPTAADAHAGQGGKERLAEERKEGPLGGVFLIS